MTDTIERVISNSGNFFGVACNTTKLVTEACRRHDVGPVAAVALGRALTGAALLAALLKDQQSILLKFEGNGPLQKVITEAGYDGWVRGYVAEPHADLPLRDGLIDVAGGIGHAGLLTVVKTISDSQRYPGTIQLYSSEIAEDIAYYLSQSEQTPSTIALTTQVNQYGEIEAAGGFLIQCLPPADESVLTVLENDIAALPPLSSLLLDGTQPSELLSRIFQRVPHRCIASRELSYNCSCNREKMAAAVSSLGAADLRDLSEKEGGAEVVCEFCRLRYRFSGEELVEMAKAIENPAH